MTEQPIETEQEYLGNEAHLNDAIVQSSMEPPFLAAIAEKAAGMFQPRQHYSPNAHLRRPSWSPVDDVELAALVRKCVNASKLLAIAKAESAKAEDALSRALEVEDTAATAVLEAERALIALTRKDTGL